MAQLAIAPARTDPLTGRCTHLSATMAGYGQIVLGFRRTCKVPDNDEKFYAPDLGPYLLYDVKKYRGLPRSILDAGGWFIAMRDDEAMYVDFGSSRKFNVTVGSHTSRKAHCIVGWRHYLDGLPDSDSPGCVRQFVAAPASGRSQINSSDELLVDDLSLAIRTPKDVLNQAGIIVTTRDMEEVNIPINDVTTVDQLKSRIEHEMGVPKNVQRIVFRGKQLEDDTTLSSNGIAEGTAVHLVERMTGGGSGCLPAFFASHKMILKPGDRIWQPEAFKEEETQTSWAEIPTVIRVHILNAENVRDWTGIDPPQSTVDPERYKSAGLSSAGDKQEYERRALENPDLYDQIEEYYYGKSTIMPLREHNPFRVILRKNAEDQSNETRGQGSKSKIRWWHRIFQKSK